MIKKECSYCKKFYPENAFGVALTTKAKTYRRRKCRDCYRLMKQALINRHYKWINDYKQQHGCEKCKIMDPRVLDFHHKNHHNKLFGVSGVRRAIGFKRLQEESKKCEVVCANCHRILHAETRKNGV